MVGKDNVSNKKNQENLDIRQKKIKRIRLLLATVIILILTSIGYRNAIAATNIKVVTSAGGTQYFDDLQEALNNAIWFSAVGNNSGGTVYIRNNIKSDACDIHSGQNITIMPEGGNWTISYVDTDGDSSTGGQVDHVPHDDSFFVIDNAILNVQGNGSYTLTIDAKKPSTATSTSVTGDGTFSTMSSGMTATNGATINWKSGAIMKNANADLFGTGIQCVLGSQINMSGGEVTGCTGGVACGTDSTLTVTGGSSHDNIWGILTVSNSPLTVTIKGGSFYNNYLYGAHLNSSKGTMNISGGSYYNNGTAGIANNEGNASITGGTLNITSCNIYSNTHGIDNYGTLNVASNFIVNTNNPIYLGKGTYIYITGALNNTTVGVITPESYTNGTTVVRTAYSGANANTVFSKFSLTASGSYLLRTGDKISAIADTDIYISSKYTFSYNANGGSGAPSAQTKYWSENLVLSSTKPTRTGYTFSSWNTKSDGSGTKCTPGGTVTGNASYTLYAQWTANTYNIKYDLNDVSPTSTPVAGINAPTSGTYDTAFSVSNPSMTGYTFSGWKITGMDSVTHTYGSSTTTSTSISSTKATSFKNLTSVNGATVTFTAQWTQNTYTINYSGNDTTKNIYGDVTTTKYDTSTSTASTSCKYDSDVTLAKNGFSKTGYTFKGWNIKSDGTGIMYSSGQTLTKPNFTATDGGSVTLYAIWEPITYTIKLHSNDDSLGNWNTTDSYTQTVRFDRPTKLAANQFKRTAPITLSDNTQLSEGYQFIGWSNGNKENTKNLIEDQATVTSLTSTNGGTVNLYATWQKDLTLVFNPNTGTYKDASTETKQPITLSASIYNNQYTYTFNIDNGTTPLSNNKYTVQTGKIKAYGTSTGTKKASTLVNGENSILTKFTTDGTNYRFLGWNFSSSQTVPNNQFDVFADGSIKSNKNTRISNYTVYDDTTLYAIYEPILTVSIDLDRVLGSLNANETNSLESIRTSDGKQSIDLTIKAGEQAQYKIATTGHSSKQLQVVFDSRITDIYTHGDNSSPWKDTLNTLVDLNKTIKPLDKTYTTKFFIPMYLGTTSSYDTSNPTIAKDTDDYATVFKVYQDSYYYETYKGIKEQVQVTANIHLKNTHTSDDDMKDEEPTDSVLEKLKARLKIKLNF